MCAFITDINCSHRIICIAFGSSEQSERASENGRKTHSQPELIAVVQQIVSKLWHPLKWHERIFYYVTPIAGIGCSVCAMAKIPQSFICPANENKYSCILYLLLHPTNGVCCCPGNKISGTTWFVTATEKRKLHSVAAQVLFTWKSCQVYLLIGTTWQEDNK